MPIDGDISGNSKVFMDRFSTNTTLTVWSFGVLSICIVYIGIFWAFGGLVLSEKNFHIWQFEKKRTPDMCVNVSHNILAAVFILS